MTPRAKPGASAPGVLFPVFQCPKSPKMSGLAESSQLPAQLRLKPSASDHRQRPRRTEERRHDPSRRFAADDVVVRSFREKKVELRLRRRRQQRLPALEIDDLVQLTMDDQ